MVRGSHPPRNVDTGEKENRDVKEKTVVIFLVVFLKVHHKYLS